MSNTAQKPSLPNEETINKSPKAGHLLEIINPPQKLKDNIKYIEFGKGAIHPVEKANRQLEFLSIDFALWIKDDINKLEIAWNKLLNQKNDPTAFLEFNKTVHVIKGNAAIMGFNKTSDMATPLAKLLERSTHIDEFFDIISLMVQAIALSSSKKAKNNENTQNEICIAFETIIKSAIEQT